MNKLVVIFMILFALAACNSNQKNNSGTTEKTSSTETNVAVENPVAKTSIEIPSSETGGAVVHLTTETFKQKVFNYDVNKEWKYEGTTPCIIDFYADWCGPCKKIAPIMNQLAQEYDGKIIIYKVDTEKQQELAAAFGIRSIPSILFVPVNGQPQMAQGALPKENFVQAIEEVLLGQKKSS